jgi:hypothetical protein
MIQTQTIVFLAVLGVMLVSIIILDLKFNMLRDDSILDTKKPYSYARVQLAWWSVIVLTCFITIITKDGNIPTLASSTLILLGISAGTTASARIIDVSDQKKAVTSGNLVTSQNTEGENFFLDILSDNNGPSIHRFQSVVINLVFGIWFVYQVLTKMHVTDINTIMPDISSNNLILLGLSAGTYVALKTQENSGPKS